MADLTQNFLLEKFNFLLNIFPDFIGCLGTIIVLIAYVLLQVKKLDADSVSYSLLNLGGSLMILASLFYSWNLAAVAMEVAWIIISAFGLIKVVFPYGLTDRKKQLENRS